MPKVLLESGMRAPHCNLPVCWRRRDGIFRRVLVERRHYFLHRRRISLSLLRLRRIDLGQPLSSPRSLVVGPEIEKVLSARDTRPTLPFLRRGAFLIVVAATVLLACRRLAVFPQPPFPPLRLVPLDLLLGEGAIFFLGSRHALPFVVLLSHSYQVFRPDISVSVSHDNDLFLLVVVVVVVVAAAAATDGRVVRLLQLLLVFLPPWLVLPLRLVPLDVLFRRGAIFLL